MESRKQHFEPCNKRKKIENNKTTMMRNVIAFVSITNKPRQQIIILFGLVFISQQLIIFFIIAVFFFFAKFESIIHQQTYWNDTYGLPTN